LVYNDVLRFWFEELEPKQWFMKSDELDKTITERFQEIHQKASTGELFDWRETAQGSLAEIIVLDQFSRNIYRDKPAAFASDPLALVLAQEAITKQFDVLLSDNQRVFLYMPYMHSESKIIHREAIRLFELLGIENNLDYERKHKVIIDEFGRYPHRNEILGRQSTDAELAFLQQPGSSF
jgi:uncharacterized protein (DUF924 family)